jgi:hypothetical protein
MYIEFFLEKSPRYFIASIVELYSTVFNLLYSFPPPYSHTTPAAITRASTYAPARILFNQAVNILFP